MSSDGFRKYLEAGAVLGHVTRARAEEIVRDLAAAGDVQRDQVQESVDELLEWSRQASERVIQLVRGEVTTQLEALGVHSVDQLAQQVANLLRRSGDAGRGATTRATRTAATARDAAKGGRRGSTTTARTATRPAKKAPAKKAPAKSTAKRPAKKAAAKRATKKAPAKKAPTKKTAKRPAAAKKAPTTRTPAKKRTTRPSTSAGPGS